VALPAILQEPLVLGEQSGACHAGGRYQNPIGWVTVEAPGQATTLYGDLGG
jgi:hypothetical protein